jgi:hypothetical protein
LEKDMSKSTTTTCTPTAVDADGVCASQSPGAGAILINGALAAAGVATFGAAQLVRLTSGGNDSGITFTFNGTDADGNTQTQTVAGTSASNTDTTLYFKTITSITHTGSVATTVVVGNLIGSVSPTLKVDTGINPFSLSLVAELVSGTATFAADVTYGDYNPYPALWIVHAAITGKSATFASTQTAPIAGIRLRLSASSSGNVRLRCVQAGA